MFGILPRQARLTNHTLRAVIGLIIVLFCVEVYAQPAQSRTVSQTARAIDPVTILLGNTPVTLWGLERVSGVSPVFELRARSALDNALGKGPLTCNLRDESDGKIFAQCISESKIDLTLFMIQQGYAAANRRQILGTSFEQPLITAETQAHDRGLGLWAQETNGNSGGPGMSTSVLFACALLIFASLVGLFVFLSIVIIRGFQRVTDAQKDNLDMMMRERKMRDKERNIIVSMLDAELKSNKTKIEAYLVVYEEMLKSLRDEDRIPKYRKSGDIVQAEPALDRAVFDRNTDKLDILGARLASQLIGFYSDIKTNPAFITVEPEMERPVVIKMVETSVTRALALNTAIEGVIEAFSKAGFGV
jgi:hypothetical protein